MAPNDSDKVIPVISQRSTNTSESQQSLLNNLCNKNKHQETNQTYHLVQMHLKGCLFINFYETLSFGTNQNRRRSVALKLF